MVLGAYCKGVLYIYNYSTRGACGNKINCCGLKFLEQKCLIKQENYAKINIKTFFNILFLKFGNYEKLYFAIIKWGHQKIMFKLKFVKFTNL